MSVINCNQNVKIKSLNVINFSNKINNQMKAFNSTLQLKNQLTSKYANFGAHRKKSYEINFERQVFENLDSFAKEDVGDHKKTKKSGRIIRNSSNHIDNSSKKVTNNQNNSLKYTAISTQLAYQPNLIPLKESLTSRLQTNLNKAAQPGNQADLQYKLKRNVRSASSHFELQYQNLIQQYQKKKQSINHQIQSFKSKQTIKIQPKYQPSTPTDTYNLQTPKFGSNLHVRTVNAKNNKSLSSSKTPKQSKWAKFIELIKAQMKAQQKLRNFKHQISNEQKQQVTAILKKKYGIEEDITTIDCQQFDPYFQRNNLSTQVITSEIANSFLCSQQHWNKNIKNNFLSNILSQIFDSFQSQKEKGVISLKAFVREMGILLQNQQYLRNRDLYRIYKRLQPFTKSNFIATLGNKQQKP